MAMGQYVRLQCDGEFLSGILLLTLGDETGEPNRNSQHVEYLSHSDNVPNYTFRDDFPRTVCTRRVHVWSSDSKYNKQIGHLPRYFKEESEHI